MTTFDITRKAAVVAGKKDFWWDGGIYSSITGMPISVAPDTEGESPDPAPTSPPPKPRVARAPRKSK
jgi:hypothetical protein